MSPAVSSGTNPFSSNRLVMSLCTNCVGVTLPAAVLAIFDVKNTKRQDPVVLAAFCCDCFVGYSVVDFSVCATAVMDGVVSTVKFPEVLFSSPLCSAGQVGNMVATPGIISMGHNPFNITTGSENGHPVNQQPYDKVFITELGKFLAV